jgi:hypothetical protein
MKPLEPRMTKSAAWRAIIAIWIGSALIGSPALIFSAIIPDPHNSRTFCIMVWPDGRMPTDSTFEFGYTKNNRIMLEQFLSSLQSRLFYDQDTRGIFFFVLSPFPFTEMIENILLILSLQTQR